MGDSFSDLSPICRYLNCPSFGEDYTGIYPSIQSRRDCMFKIWIGPVLFDPDGVVLVSALNFYKHLTLSGSGIYPSIQSRRDGMFIDWIGHLLFDPDGVVPKFFSISINIRPFQGLLFASLSKSRRDGMFIA